jgi:hypothetical protein
MNVHLHIERLVLAGVPVEVGNGDSLRAAIEAELTRQLSRGDLAPGMRSGSARRQVATSAIGVNGDDTPATLGRKIGGVLHGGLIR